MQSRTDVSRCYPFDSSRDPESLTRLVDALFFAGAFVILAIAMQSWIAQPFPRPFHPALPYQYTASTDPRLWLFLQQASPCIERGAAFSVIAPTAEEEHELYVLSVGVVAHAKPLAATYFGFRQPQHVRRARFVAAFGAAAPPPTFRVKCRNPLGAVYESRP